MQRHEPRSTFRVAVDIGGTFTDLQVLDESAGTTHAFKTPSTPDDPSEGLIVGLRLAAARLGFGLGQVSALMHGTTIATNAVLQRRLPKGALITTDGFEDVLEIGRHFRRDVYAAKAEPRAILVPRAWRLTVPERVRATGEIERPLDEPAVITLATRLVAGDVRCVAVALLHAYANPAHERRIGDLLARHAPGVDVSLSHEISPEIREFERTSTTVLNALLMPVVRGYLERLRARLAAEGFAAPVYLVQSNGGVTTPETAAVQPARLLLSGPSGGALAAETISRRLSMPSLVAVDMGGTSYDVSLVVDGQIRLVTEGTVDGLPVRLPMIEIRTIGSGGGSIASVDQSGRMRVGPESAGAKPGPVCYRRGGSEPTVTDANVAMGRIDPAFFLGGAMTLDKAGAEAAILSRVAEPLAMSSADAALGIARVASSRMAGAIRLSLFEKGLDPEDFTLLSFGGASGLHACETADEIGISRVVFPRDPGTLSAWGMLYSDIVHALARARLMEADAAAVAEIERIVADLAAEGRRMLVRDGVPEEACALPVTLDLRYPGQAYEIQVPLVTPTDLAAAVTAFHARHEAQYAHAEPHVTPEIVTIRVAATGRLPKPVEKPHRFDAAPAAAKAPRRVLVGDGWHECPVLSRASLRAGEVMTGPLIIEEDHATHLLPPGWQLVAAPTGDLIATRREGNGR